MSSRPMIRAAAVASLSALLLIGAPAWGQLLLESPPPYLPGDADMSGNVDLSDFVTLKNNFGAVAVTDGASVGDFNGDGSVNLSDFVILKNNFGAGGGPTFVDDFKPGWTADQDDWRIAIWTQNGTEMSRDRCVDNGQGFLVQTVLAGEPYRGGSMESKGEWPYGRWVARIKPSSVPGVLNSMFTKDWDDKTTPADWSDGTSFEVDIEFLTYTFGPGRGQVHLAIHLAGHPNYHAVDVDLDFNPSDDFHEVGFIILPDVIVWTIDDEIIHTWNVPAEVNCPPNYEMFFNSWTKDMWILGPPTQDADYLIDWVAFWPIEP